MNGIPQDKLEFLKTLESVEIIEHELSLSYDNETVDSTLEQILPKNVPPISSFETAGHIAHVNLRYFNFNFDFFFNRFLKTFCTDLLTMF